MATSKYFYPGAQFGKLTLLRPAPKSRIPKGSKVKSGWWVCRCGCGRDVVVAQYRFRHKNPKTHCGCLDDFPSAKHPREYGVWQMMNVRCSDPRHMAYKYYGGRGIQVCDQWKYPDGFYQFLADMGPRPPGKSLDRIDPDKGYSPDNCRWATKDQQAWNKRKTVYVRHPVSGVKMAAGQLAKALGIPYQKLRADLIKEGKWPPMQKSQSLAKPTVNSPTTTESSPPCRKVN